MSRKKCHRRPITPLPPRGLRPGLDRAQLLDLGLAHVINLDLIATGKATTDELWQALGGALTWSRVAQLLGVGQVEMAEQMAVLEAVVARWQRTGRVGFSGTEYQRAKDGVALMDELARIVDRPTAVAAAEWGEARVNRVAAQKRAEAAAAA